MKLLLVLLYTAQALHMRPTSLKDSEEESNSEMTYKGKVMSDAEVKTKLQQSTVVFMLPTKMDRNEHLPYLRANIEKVGALFKDFAVVIGTPGGEEELKAAADWKKEADKKYEVYVTTQEKNSNVDCSKWVFYNTVGKITKACKIAKGRDAILKEIFEQHKGKFDYAIAVDTDMTKQWNTQSFLKAFSLDDDWAMVAANGIASDTKEHQDWFPWKSSRHYTQPHVFKADEDAFQVKGAFGGVAVYRTNLMEGCTYASCMRMCEHNCFEDCLTKKGRKLYFHPGFVVEWPVYKIDGQRATDEQRLDDIKATWTVKN